MASVVMTLLVALIVIGVIVTVVIAVTSGLVRQRGGAGVVATSAEVLGVREVNAVGGMQHWVSFRFEDGHHRELLATPSQARVIFRGQQGTVHYAGDRLTGWVPEVGGGPQDTHRSE